MKSLAVLEVVYCTADGASWRCILLSLLSHIAVWWR